MNREEMNSKAALLRRGILVDGNSASRLNAEADVKRNCMQVNQMFEKMKTMKDEIVQCFDEVMAGFEKSVPQVMSNDPKYKSRAFLGGTCNGSKWRLDLIDKIKNIDAQRVVTFFDPQVTDWNEEAMEIEKHAKEQSTHQVYCFTPRMIGYYGIAEVVDAAHRDPGGTIFCYLEQDGDLFFTEPQIKSLNAIGNMIGSLGGMWAPDLETIADILHNGVRSGPGNCQVEA